MGIRLDITRHKMEGKYMQNEKFEALVTAKEYLGRLIPGLESINDSFREGDVSLTEDFVDGMQGIAWIVEVMVLTEDCHDVRIDVTEINNHLEAINEAFENEDFALVADIAHYEILPVLEECEKALQSVNN